MIKNNVVILGGNALNAGVVSNFKALGYNVIVVDYREEIDLASDIHLVTDAKDVGVVEKLKSQGIDSIAAVYTSMDNAGMAQQAICQAYGLYCANADAIEKAHNKSLMHATWKSCGLLNRESFSLQSLDLTRITHLAAKTKIIIKPADSCASRGITILDPSSPTSAIQDAFKYAQQYTENGLVNIEEFVEGTEYTVEMLGDNEGHVSVYAISKKYHTENISNNKVAVKLHYNPSDVADELLLNIAEYGAKCYKALGLKNTFGHLELIVKDSDGSISPIEIGSRSSGFIASHLVDYVSEQCYLEGLIKVQNGGSVADGYIGKSDKSAMYYFYDIPGGTKLCRSLKLLDFLPPDVRSFAHDRSKLVAGTDFKELTQDTDRYGYEILAGPREVLTIRSVTNAENEFLKRSTE